MTKIVSFGGISNSGKTTLIEKLSTILTPNFKVGIIKHDPKNKAQIDTVGKDSYKFFQTGAQTAIVSPLQTTIRFQSSLSNEHILDIMNTNEKLDYLFIEGFKMMGYRKICVIRDDFSKSDIESCDAIATTKPNMKNFKNKILLDLDNHEEILEWIDNGK